MIVWRAASENHWKWTVPDECSGVCVMSLIEMRSQPTSVDGSTGQTPSFSCAMPVILPFGFRKP